MSIRKKLIYKTADVLEKFARSVPNSKSMLVDWSHDTMTVVLAEANVQMYSIADILESFKSLARNKGYEIEYR